MFLEQSDFTNLIFQDNLVSVIDGNQVSLTQTMLEAQSEIENYLRGAFDLSQIFVEYGDYDAAQTYDADIYKWFETEIEVNESPVTVNQLYRCKTAVSVGQSPLTHPAKWEAKDPRHAQIVQIYKDVTLYHIHSAIAPSSIPELRLLRYKDAVATLRHIRDGKLYTNLPKIEKPNYGIQMASQERQNWYW